MPPELVGYCYGGGHRINVAVSGHHVAVFGGQDVNRHGGDALSVEQARELAKLLTIACDYIEGQQQTHVAAE